MKQPPRPPAEDSEEEMEEEEEVNPRDGDKDDSFGDGMFSQLTSALRDDSDEGSDRGDSQERGRERLGDREDTSERDEMRQHTQDREEREERTPNRERRSNPHASEPIEIPSSSSSPSRSASEDPPSPPLFPVGSTSPGGTKKGKSVVGYLKKKAGIKKPKKEGSGASDIDGLELELDGGEGDEPSKPKRRNSLSKAMFGGR